MSSAAVLLLVPDPFLSAHGNSTGAVPLAFHRMEFLVVKPGILFNVIFDEWNFAVTPANVALFHRSLEGGVLERQRGRPSRPSSYQEESLPILQSSQNWSPGRLFGIICLFWLHPSFWISAESRGFLLYFSSLFLFLAILDLLAFLFIILFHFLFETAMLY